MHTTMITTIILLVTLAALQLIQCVPVPSPVLGGCERFALHGETAVTSAGGETVYGDVGSSVAYTGFKATPIAPYSYFGEGSTEVINCKSDKSTAYDFLRASTCGSRPNNGSTLVNCAITDSNNETVTFSTTSENCTLSGGATDSPGSDLSGLTLYPGVYCTANGFFRLTAGAVTLDGLGDSDSVFIFQAATDIITSSSTEIILTNGAEAKNIYWQAGTAVVLGEFSLFSGNIYAGTKVDVGVSAQILGRALAGSAISLFGTNTFTLPELSIPGESSGIESSSDLYVSHVLDSIASFNSVHDSVQYTDSQQDAHVSISTVQDSAEAESSNSHPVDQSNSDFAQSNSYIPIESNSDTPIDSSSDLPAQSNSGILSQSSSDIPAQSSSDILAQSNSDIHVQSSSDIPVHSSSDIPTQSNSDIPAQSSSDIQVQSSSDIPIHSTSDIPAHTTEVSESENEETVDVSAFRSVHDSAIDSQKSSISRSESQIASTSGNNDEESTTIENSWNDSIGISASNHLKVTMSLSIALIVVAILG